jgi:hypothetical protein
VGYLIRFLLHQVEANGRPAIHAGPDPDQPQQARLSLVGTPATLTPAERERLFSPFAIASDRLLHAGPGVSQKIVEAHGGTLTLGGPEGEVRFTLTLPSAVIGCYESRRVPSSLRLRLRSTPLNWARNG